MSVCALRHRRTYINVILSYSEVSVHLCRATGTHAILDLGNLHRQSDDSLYTRCQLTTGFSLRKWNSLKISHALLHCCETHFFLNVNGIGHTMVTNSASSDMSSPKHTKPSAFVHQDPPLIADMSSRAGLLALP